MRGNNCYIFTGGPGSGKTSVLHLLGKKGYSIIEESGRKIIQQQIAIKGVALPWDNQVKFRDIMLQYAIDDYLSIEESNNTVFFDRGIVDIIGYTQLIGGVVPDQLNDLAKMYQYNETVFIFPPWEEIYTYDHERKQDYDEAIKTYHQMQSAYSKHHYNLIEVPKINVRSRVAFILKMVKSL